MHDAALDAAGSLVGEPSEALGDLRFRALLGAEAWARLPPAIRRRFSKRLNGGGTAIYVGRIEATQMSTPGRLLGWVTRLIGGPLPRSCDADVPSVVTVTEDCRNHGQIWTRVYARRAGFPQVIHSSKSFDGPTGLEEHVGGGVGMALSVEAIGGALVFRSAGFFWRVGPLRLRLPTWLTPGSLTVTHTETGDGSFRFTLEIVHSRFGRLIRQSAVFREEMP